MLVLEGCEAEGERYCVCWGVDGLLDWGAFALGRLDGRREDCAELTAL